MHGVHVLNPGHNPPWTKSPRTKSRKPFIIADTNALNSSGGILSYLCRLEGGFCPGDYVQGGFCPFPNVLKGAFSVSLAWYRRVVSGCLLYGVRGAVLVLRCMYMYTPVNFYG